MSRKTPADTQRFDRVYAENVPLILSYATRRCDDPSDAADVVADVFLIAWRRFGDLPEGQERLWLYGTARRVLANQRRGQRRRNRLAERLRDELHLRPPVTVPDGTAGVVLAAMAQLPDSDRELLALATWDGLTPAEIATLEEVPAATVRSRLMRARNRLRAALDEQAVCIPAQRSASDGHVSGEAHSASSKPDSSKSRSW